MNSISSYVTLDDSKLCSVSGGHNKLAYKVGHIAGSIAIGLVIDSLL